VGKALQLYSTEARITGWPAIIVFLYRCLFFSPLPCAISVPDISHIRGLFVWVVGLDKPQVTLKLLVAEAVGATTTITTATISPPPLPLAAAELLEI